mmetsp:Transcript_26994/g.43238  ORF Transcript_26994/g.43238 Transcript_26994/m.43238 type:complete len:296 (+) Transcript_26994:77-964(+)
MSRLGLHLPRAAPFTRPAPSAHRAHAQLATTSTLVSARRAHGGVTAPRTSRRCGERLHLVTGGRCALRRRRAGLATAASNEDDGVSSADLDSPPWSVPGYRGAQVSSLPESTQAASVFAVWAGLAGLTALACGTVGPALSDAFPEYMAWSRGTWPVLGVTYIAAGAAHFGVKQGFLDMFPHKGAWGFFNIPGSPSFHVTWTGVAEVLGGVGIASALLPLDTPDWITPAAAWGMFLLTLAVTPANTYMWSHNAPGPLPEDADESMAVLPWYGHLARGLLQVLLLSITWGLAHPPPQ